MLATLRSAGSMFVFLTLLTGVIYPAIVTVTGQLVFPHQANGSIVVREGREIGSELIGQTFSDPKYFWGRPSATNPPNDAAASSGSNLGPTNPDWIATVKQRTDFLRATRSEQTGPIPVELVTASASGLDPHISPAAAEFQISRVAKARNRNIAEIRELVEASTESRTLSVLGEPRVNILKLNLALDGKR